MHFYLDNSLRSVKDKPRKSSHRLSTTVVPSHYRLYIDASQLQQHTFQGTVDIDILVKYFEHPKKIFK